MLRNRFPEQLRHGGLVRATPRFVEVARFEFQDFKCLPGTEVEHPPQADFSKVSHDRLLTSAQICPLSRVLETCGRLVFREVNTFNPSRVVAIRSAGSEQKIGRRFLY